MRSPAHTRERKQARENIESQEIPCTFKGAQKGNEADWKQGQMQQSRMSLPSPYPSKHDPDAALEKRQQAPDQGITSPATAPH
eukprot:299436-Pelagomonas_calceolata.AAC.4